MFQRCFTSLSRVLLGWFKDIFKDVTKDAYGCLKEFLKGDLRILTVFKDCLKILQRVFKDVTACFNGFEL